MKKKLLISVLLAAAMLSGCGANGNAEPAPEAAIPETTNHQHLASESYSWNGTEHWHTCECGEQIDLAAHNIGDDMRCAECGLEVWKMDDGYVDVASYDEYGNLQAMISYDPEGNVLSSQENKIEYDEHGNIMRCEYFVDGVLQSLEEYLLAEDGTTWRYSSSYFYNGETDYMVYDINDNLVSSIHYGTDGEIKEEVNNEYALNDDGDYYRTLRVALDADGIKQETAYTQYEDISYDREYDADGNLISEEIWEYGYNAEGKPDWVKRYENGTLVYEIVNFAVFTDEWDITSRYPENEVEYYEDGSRLERFNGTNTEPELETVYNADGSVSHVRRYVYELFDNGNWKRIQVYQNEVLMFDTEYVMDAENIWSYKATMTEYLDDGTKIIFEYDENEELMNQTHYDASGNVL